MCKIVPRASQISQIPRPHAARGPVVGPRCLKTNSIWIAKNQTEWSSNSLPSAQTISGNILHQKGGPAAISNLSTSEELFKSIMRPEICDIILRETNRKGKRVCDAFNNDLLSRFSHSSRRPPSKTFQLFTEVELHAFIGILIAVGIHKQDKENLDDMWKVYGLSLLRVVMSCDRFKMMLRFITSDNKSTCAERAKSDKAAPMRHLNLLNRNLENAYKPYECITID